VSRAARRFLSAIVALLLILANVPVARAEAVPDKIDPALRALMQADPLALRPVIVEMNPPARPVLPGSNGARANEALGLLRTNGRPGSALSLIQSAAGFADAAGITAISLVPTVAYVHHDATVGPRRGSPSSVLTPPTQLSAVYPRAVNADQLWAQGTTGKGVTVAVLDSGVAADVDLTSPTNRLLA
jgi:serine protease AprX